MFMIFVCYFSHLFSCCTVFSHVFFSSFAEKLSSDRSTIDASHFGHYFDVFIQWVGSIEILYRLKINSMFVFYSIFRKKLHTLEESEPLSIFSKPTDKTQSAFPDSMICFPNNKAEEPVEQLLFTLNIGIPVIPIPYNALCPHVESPIFERKKQIKRL